MIDWVHLGRMIMSNSFSCLGKLVLVVMMVFVANACTKKSVPVKQEFPPVSDLGTTGPGGGPQGAGGMGLNENQWRELGLNNPAERQEFMAKAQAFENDDIHFSYNGYVLTEEARSILQKKVEFLKRYPKVKVTIEGHCDERGTSEYNLALGERRATSSYQYLANSGVVTGQLSMISYGKERPLAPGHDEASWAKNRRAHFALNF
jgi:peptidoglycan-associated lipoprotein